MGDGRYFTWHQFIQIVYYTILSMVLVFNIVYLNTKSRKRRTLKYLLIIQSLLLVMTMLKFYEATINVFIHAKLLREGQLLIALLALSFSIQIFFKNKPYKILTWIGLWSVLLVIGYVGFGEDWLLIAYPDYGRAYYDPVYITLVALMCVVIVVGAFRQMFFDRGITKYDELHNRFIGIAIALPSVFYLFYILGLTPNNVQISFGLLIISSLIILWVFVRYTPGELLPLTFNQLVEDIRETVMLFDSDGQIIYHNKTALASLLDLDQVQCENCYYQLFARFHVIERTQTDTDIRFQLGIEGVSYYLSCKQKEIMKNNKRIGYILVIEDLTHLRTMLDRLSTSTKELNTINETLRERAAVVESIEAERERNRLMLEVQNYLGHRFAELTKVIENIIGSTDEGDTRAVVAQVEDTIELAKENLSDIRKTVVDYRSSYDKSYVSR